VPKFHCPRCRDHYYGLTPFPCDEELARLIREGLWRTGEGVTSPDRSIRHGMMKASLSSTDTQRHRKTSEGDYQSSSKIKLPPLDTSKPTHSQKSSLDNSNASNTTTNKKTKKRISFALDNLGADGQSPSASETDLNLSNNSSGRKRKGSDLLTVSDTSGSNSSLDRYGLGVGGQKKSDNQSSTSKLLGSQTQLGEKGGGNLSSDANHNGKDASDKGRANSKNDSNNILGGTNSCTNGMTNQKDGKESVSLTDDGSSPKKGLGSTMSDGTVVGSATIGNFSDSENGVNCNSGDKTERGGFSTGEKPGVGVASNNRSNTSRNGKDCNVTSKTGNSSKSSGGSNNSHDSGKAKRSHKAPPGYMRAASPSQSDWGDPTHAKKWIDNVALKPTSQFKYNTDDDDNDDEFSSMTRASWHSRLRKPPKSEEPDNTLLLPLGPNLTRAFTFSYMPHAKPKK